jgi:alpha-ketoglutarate-dependent taurine dioxygenase
MAISFSPIESCAQTQPFAVCDGFDLSQDLSPDAVTQIRAALLKHGLVVFRNQKKLGPQHEVEFNRTFAWHDAEQDAFIFGSGPSATTHQLGGGSFIPGYPAVSVLGNVMLEDYHGIHNTQLLSGLGLTYAGWHADGLHDMFDGMPEMTTMFNPVGWRSVSGGETYFTSGVRALERMDSPLREELERCLVAYIRYPNDDSPGESRKVTPGYAYMAQQGTHRVGWAVDSRDPSAGLLDFELQPEHANGGGRHRCIRVHPLTGQASLYVYPANAVYLLDVETGAVRHNVEETAQLLSEALLPSALPDVRYEHVWHEGDFVAWINTLVLHSASDPTDTEGPRLLHRVRLSTPKTRWKNGRYTSY